MTPHEVLDELAVHTMGTLWGLICNIPGGTDDDRCGIATAVMGEILARTLAQPCGNERVAEITNMRLAEHQLAWRLAPVS